MYGHYDKVTKMQSQESRVTFLSSSSLHFWKMKKSEVGALDLSKAFLRHQSVTKLVFTYHIAGHCLPQDSLTIAETCPLQIAHQRLVDTALKRLERWLVLPPDARCVDDTILLAHRWCIQRLCPRQVKRWADPIASWIFNLRATFVDKLHHVSEISCGLVFLTTHKPNLLDDALAALLPPHVAVVGQLIKLGMALFDLSLDLGALLLPLLVD